MKILKVFAWLLAAALVTGFLFSTAGAADPTLSAYILPQTGDTVSVLLAQPGPRRTILVRNITVYYENAANTNSVFAGIQVASFTRTRYLWLGTPMASGAAGTLNWQNINTKILGDSARAGLILFLSAASSDTLSGYIEYEIIPD